MSTSGGATAGGGETVWGETVWAGVTGSVLCAATDDETPKAATRRVNDERTCGLMRRKPIHASLKRG